MALSHKSTRSNVSLEIEFLPLVRQINKLPWGIAKSELNKRFVQQLLNKGDLLKQHPYFVALALAKLEVLSVELSIADADRLFFKDYHRQFCRLVGTVSGDFELTISTTVIKAFRIMNEYNPLRRFSAVSNLLTQKEKDEPIQFILLYRSSALIGFAMIRRAAHYNLVLMLGVSTVKTGQQFWDTEREVVNHLRTLDGRLFFADQSVFVRRV